MDSLFEKNWVDKKLKIRVVFSTSLGKSDSSSDLGQGVLFEGVRDCGVDDINFKFVPESRSCAERFGGDNSNL